MCTCFSLSLSLSLSLSVRLYLSLSLFARTAKDTDDGRKEGYTHTGSAEQIALTAEVHDLRNALVEANDRKDEIDREIRVFLSGGERGQRSATLP